MLDWIKSFLQESSQSVVINSVNSKPSSESALSGVPQGMVLALLLFLISINDIVQDLHSSIKLYADDILIYAINISPEDCLLQSDLTSFYKWAEKWQIEFNSSASTVSNKPQSFNHD